MTGDSFVVNPSAIGNPDETPLLFMGPGLRALLNPCECGGVNGFHGEDCPAADERPTHCPECAHSLDTGEHADWCMTARDPKALRRLRGAPDERPKDGER